ncbi:MAG: pentapeptide repeat-containing protein, partial [Cyanobacteria bacterium J06642_2]
MAKSSSPLDAASDLLKNYARGDREFQRINLTGAVLIGAQLAGANLADADLSKAAMNGSILN